MSRPDDLEPGIYVAVTELNGHYQCKNGAPMCTGEPMLILAVSLPYVAMLDSSGVKCAMDTRCVTLQKMTKEYARVFMKRQRARKLTGPEHPMCGCGPIPLEGLLLSSVSPKKPYRKPKVAVEKVKYNPHLPNPVYTYGFPTCPKCDGIVLQYSKAVKCLICPKCEQRVNAVRGNS